MNLQLLTDGGTKWQKRLNDALKAADIKQSIYNTKKADVTKTLVSQKLLLPLYVDFSSGYGERWRGLFQLIQNSGEHQTVIIPRNQFFPVMDDLSLTKRCYLLPAKRWESSKEINLGVREALEAQLEGFSFEQVTTADDVPTGLDFEGIGPNSDMKVITPYNILREKAMYNNAAFRKMANVKPHMGRDDLSQAFNQGIRIVAQDIPSLSGEEAPHKLTITNVPIYVESLGQSEKTKRIGYGIKTSDDCSRGTFSDYKYSRTIKQAFGLEERTRSENELDHHSIFVLGLAADIVAAQYPGIILDNPIPNVPEGVEELVDVAFRRVRIIDYKIANGGKMLWESVAMMQIYTMMACAYVNTKNRETEKIKRR